MSFLIYNELLLSILTAFPPLNKHFSMLCDLELYAKGLKLAWTRGWIGGACKWPNDLHAKIKILMGHLKFDGPFGKNDGPKKT